MTDDQKILIRYYEDAAKKLRGLILSPPGGTVSGQAWRQADAAMRLRQIEQVVTQLKGRAARLIGKGVQADYQKGLRHAIAEAKRWGIAAPTQLQGMEFSIVDRGAVEALAKDEARDLYAAADSMGKNSARVLRATADNGLTQSEIDRIIAGGVVEGRPIDAIRKLRDELRKIHGGGLVTITDRNGDAMTFRASYYAEMVVRTKARQANTVGTTNRLLESGIELVIIQGAVSNNFCTGYLGRVFSIRGDHPKYPSLDSLQGGGPPFHPNCSKSISAWVEEFHGTKADDVVEPSDDVRKLIGVTPAEAQRRFNDLQLRAQAGKQLANVEKAMAA